MTQAAAIEHIHAWGPQGCYCGAKRCSFDSIEEQIAYSQSLPAPNVSQCVACTKAARPDLLSKDRCEDHQRPRVCSNCRSEWCDGTRCV